MSIFASTGAQKFASVALSDTGTLVAAISDKKIRLLACILVAGGQVGLNFENGTTNISGIMTVAANGGFCLPLNEAGWCETDVNAALGLTMSDPTAVGGMIVYQELTS